MRIKLNIQRFAEDGTVIINVKADTKDFEKQIDQIQTRLKELDDKDTHEIYIGDVKVDGDVTSLTDEEIEEYNRLLDELEKLQTEAQNSANQLSTISDQTGGMSELKEEIKEVNDVIDDQKEAIGQLADTSSQGNIFTWNVAELEQELKKSTNELRALEREAERLQNKKIKIEANLEDYYTALDQTRQMTDEWLQTAQTTEQVENVLGMEDKQIEQINQKYSEQLSQLDEINAKIQENADSQSAIKVRVEETNAKLEDVRGFDKIKGSIGGINKGLNTTVKKVIRWGLALLGIRTVLSILTQSFSTLKQYNTELAQKMDDMRLMLAVALEPVINFIVQLAEQLLYVLAQIYEMLFGIDLYARANELSAKKMADSYGSASKSARDMRKQLAGFDEMNVLSDNVGASGKSGGGFNLKPPEEGNEPKWMQWLKDYGDLILAILGGIATALILLKLGVKGIKALGIGAIVGGVIYAVRKLLKYLKDPTWKNFGGIVQGIGVALIGLGLVTNNIKLIIIGAIVLIVGTFFRYWEKIKTTLEKGVKWLEEKSQWIHKKLGGVIGAIYDTLVADIRFIWDYFKDLTEAIKLKFDGIIQFIKGVFHKDWHEAFEGLYKIAKADLTPIFAFVEGMFNRIKTIGKTWAITFANMTTDVIKSAVNTVLGSVEMVINDFVGLLNGIIKIANKLPLVNVSTVKKVKLPRLAQGGIVNNPGPGVNMGSYIAGESGPEAVIPLDDKTLDRLGLAFARHTIINANITNTMNGRVISRELQKIQNSRDFAFNS